MSSGGQAARARLAALLSPDLRLSFDGYVEHGLCDLIGRFVTKQGNQWLLATYVFPRPQDVGALEARVKAVAPDATLTGLPLVNRELIERALPHLVSRDPARFWTSGQWMTEPVGGSDVGLAEAEARFTPGEGWRLYGRKWFTSAITSQMALTLARPADNPPGGKGLAMFYLETRDADGLPNRLSVDRLKDKLGTRAVPTAEADFVDAEVALAAARDAKLLIRDMRTVSPYSLRISVGTPEQNDRLIRSLA